MITFFGKISELRELTGLTYEGLLEAGFNLDDMDFGIVCDRPLSSRWLEDVTVPYYESWLLNEMDSYCVGYEYVEYHSKHYYTVHHS